MMEVLNTAQEDENFTYHVTKNIILELADRFDSLISDGNVIICTLLDPRFK